MNIYVALGALLLGAVAPSLASPASPLRILRFLPILALYPLFAVMLAAKGVGLAGTWWAVLAGVALVLELWADAQLPRENRQRWPTAAWKTALLWPFLLPANVEAMLVRMGVAPAPRAIGLPEPPRGSQLLTLPDDELLIAAYQILAGHPALTADEQAVLAAESFNREVHCDGLLEWFCEADGPTSDTIRSLHTVGAHADADLLQQVVDAAPRTWREDRDPETRRRALESVAPLLRSVEATLLGRTDDQELSAQVARFVRRNISRCPALEASARDEDG